MAELQLVRTPEPVPEAARRLGQYLRTILAQQGSARLAIPGGSALAAFGEVRRRLDPDQWKRLWLTWVDERRVPLDSAESNRGEAYRQGILGPQDPLGMELPLFLDNERPDEACQRVEAVLLKDFEGRLDLVLLGMGEDGHIASLFPGGIWAPAPARVQIVENAPKPPPERISLSLSFLATASEAVILITGSSKREALQRLLRGDPSLPASALPRLTVVTDLEP